LQSGKHEEQMMTFETIELTIVHPVRIIRINRPERRNAVSLKVMEEIITAAKESESDPQTFALIITGGDTYFSAGADLNETLGLSSAGDGVEYFKNWHRLNDTLERLTKPVIAAIEGFCMTGGAELAMACDIRIAAQGASFAITSSKIGTVAGAGGTQRLPRLVGPSKAIEIMLSGDPIDAAEAHRIGLVNRLVANGQTLTAAKELAATYAKRAPLSLAWIKRAVYGGMQMDLTSAIEFETYLASAIYTTNDSKEGISAFLQKRVPSFSGN
jgi:enoyl-CoA hydratase/carnithine racemase